MSSGAASGPADEEALQDREEATANPNSDDTGDPELTPPQQGTAQDEAALFSARRPLVVSPGRLYGFIEHVSSVSLMGIMSFFGTLIRLGLVAIGSYNGQSIFPLLWAQMMGCCLMGMLTVRKRCVEEIYIPLYVGLTTGLCGSITSFSSWMGDNFQAFAQIGTPAHGGFYNVRAHFSEQNALYLANVTHPQFMDGLGISIVTLGASSAAFVLGTQAGPYILHPTALHFIARWIRFNRYGRFSEQRPAHSSKKQAMTLENGSLNDGHASEFRPNGKTSESRRASQHSHTIATENLKANYPAWLQLQLVLLFLLMWLATILISIYVSKWRGIVMFALVFSPVGVWLRFELSQLNIKHPSFPVGTFLANQIGTAVLALLVALQFTPGKTLLQCQIMQGLLDGFCGTLTTVSTFIVELKKLERRNAYVYALASWMVGQILMLVILGSVDFARGGLMEAKCAI